MNERERSLGSADALKAKLGEWAESADTQSRHVGTAFERLCIFFLANDRIQSTQLTDPRPYADWAGELGLDKDDRGIDLVAGVRDGGGKFAAIQCKFRRAGGVIAQSEIDSFVAASDRPEFVQRILIETSEREWSANAMRRLAEVDPAVRHLGLRALIASDLDWGGYFATGEAEFTTVPPKPRRHQLDAVEAITEGLADPGSRGKVLMACGAGKTLTSLRAAERIAGNGGRVLYLVPSLALMSQTIRAWFRDKECGMRPFAVCSDARTGRRLRQDDSTDIPVSDLELPATTDAARLAGGASEPFDGMTVVFSTYQSAAVLEEAQKRHGLPRFDLAVCDEAHRTAGISRRDTPSAFTLIHDDDAVGADRRLYMTATAKVWAESAKRKAANAPPERAVSLCSMDDGRIFGQTLFEFDFHAALDGNLLSDYHVVILTVPSSAAAGVLARSGRTDDGQTRLEEAGLMLGCWRALAKIDSEKFPDTDRKPMSRAIAFCGSINESKRFKERFNGFAETYKQMIGGMEPDGAMPAALAEHVDGTFHAESRARLLSWLDNPEEGECRVLSNARCLAEGVDVPALDALLFMQPRKSQIEVVQAVGRVMRKAEGKQRGYVILPVVVPDNADPDGIFEHSEQWKKVWQMVNAIRSHDEGFDAQINLMETGQEPNKLSIITVSQWRDPAGEARGSDGWFDGGGDEAGDRTRGAEVPTMDTVEDERQRQALLKAIGVKLVEKCGNRKYWEEWAGDVARIAQAHIDRITTLVTPGDDRDEDVEAAAELFDELLRELRDDINPAISRGQAIEMLAQHTVTLPVFAALFKRDRDETPGGGQLEFLDQSPVGQALENFLEVIKPQVDIETESLGDFYRSVERRVEAAAGDGAGRQKIISELYDKFFRSAFAGTSKALGIVYTPVEIVDFTLHSVQHILRTEFGRSMADENVHIMDPFTGTGTFIARLMQPGLLDAEALRRKYPAEIHANEIVLLAYYIASVNIQEAYAAAAGERKPYRRICLTDTFQMTEEAEDMIARQFEDNSRRRTEQMDADIDVIVGNPPWNVGKSGPKYSGLRRRIEETYARKSIVANKNSLYDSYKMAVRWASDRIGGSGIVGFVTNGSWIDGNAESGIRACLAEEFTAVHVVNLRGNQRTTGELSRQEGGKVFGSGSRAPVSVFFLVKNPAARHQGCRILYHDIGDYLTRGQKIEKIAAAKSIAGLDGWETIEPSARHGWINKREEGFEQLLPLGSKEVKAGRPGGRTAVFQLFSRGIETARDAYLYNFSRAACEASARKAIERYKAALNELRTPGAPADLTELTARHSRGLHWNDGLRQTLKRQTPVEFDSRHIRPVQYRPFVPTNCYAEKLLVHRRAAQHRIFPRADTVNQAICVSGIGSDKPFSALMVDGLPDLHCLSFGQCFPRYRFAEASAEDGLALERETADGSGLVRIDNITDEALTLFRSRCGDPSITKDDVFYYVYGALHAPDFRKAFRNALAKELPAVPLAGDFHAFAQAGRRLAELHTGYGSCGEFPLELRFSGTGGPQPHHFRLTRKGMKFSGRRPDLDKSVLIVNDFISLAGIPEAAHQYEVNGKTPLGWLIDRYKVSTDKKSGIVNDANGWFDRPEDLIPAIKRIVHVSVRTAEIVGGLPASLPGGNRTAD